MTTPVRSPRPQRLPDEFLAELRSRARHLIYDLAVDYSDLKPAASAGYKGLCPFHDERTPSFVVSPDSGRYICFGCNASGDSISLLTELGGLTFREAVDELAGKVGLQVPAGDDTTVGDDPRGRLRAALAECQPHLHEWLTSTHPAARGARDFLRSRGFTSAHAEHWGIGFLPPGQHLRDVVPNKVTTETLIDAGMLTHGRDGTYDTFAGRLLWPLHDPQGRIIGYAGRDLDGTSRAKYINTRETPLYRKHETLFGLHAARRSMLRNKQVYLVEGYTDVMAMVDAGIDNTVATCGTAVTSAHADMIAARIGDGGEVVAGFDNDDAGRAAAWKAFLAVQHFTTNVTTLNLSGTATKGDPCDVRQHLGASALGELTESRPPLLRTVLRSDIDNISLDTPEGKTAARDAVARRLSEVTDPVLRREYVPVAAEWIGIHAADFGDLSGTKRRHTQREHNNTLAKETPAPRRNPGPAESATALAATLMYRPEYLDIASWYGGGTLEGLLGAQLADLVENSAAIFPAGRPDPGSDDAALWAQTMLELFDEDYHAAFTAASIAEPCRPDELEPMMTRIGKAAARRRLNYFQSQMDTAEADDLPEIVGRFKAATQHYKQLSTR